MRTLNRIVCTAALAATLMLAQGPGGGPPDPATMIQNRIDFLAKHLSLTDDQKTRATTIYTAAQTAAQTAQTNSVTTRQALSAAVKKNDIAAIDQLSAQLGTVQGQVTAINSKADASFYAILTADQQALFDTVGRGGPRPRGGFGQAGFGGRGRTR